MKTINNFKIIACIMVVFTILSCKSKEPLDPISVVKVKSKGEMSKFDKYLEREFIEPYNIEVIYKLDDVETNLDYNVTPASEEKAIQIVNLIKYLCLDAYEKHTDKGFLKNNFPKKIVLVGSGAYNADHTVLLGTAQGGVKIVLYDINGMDSSDAAGLVSRYFNTIFHEFSHILHQKKMYTQDFQKISPDYVGDSWNKYWGDTDTGTPKSFTKGFISDYATKEKSEDFVEIISHQITLSDAQWDNRINPKPVAEPNDVGVALMNKKLEVVKSYLKNSWNISLDDMKTEVQDRLTNLSTVDINNID